MQQWTQTDRAVAAGQGCASGGGGRGRRSGGGLLRGKVAGKCECRGQRREPWQESEVR